MRSRSSRGSTSSRYNQVNEAPVTAARSEPEPLTHRTRTGRPRKSISSDLAEVLPPPQLQMLRSAPNLRERATSCANVVVVLSAMIVNYHPRCNDAIIGFLCSGIAASDGAGDTFAGDALGIATGAKGRDGIRIQPLALAKLCQQGTHVGLVSCLQDAVAAQHITRFLCRAQSLAVYQHSFGIGGLDVQNALNHGLDLRLDVVRLVDHIGDAPGVGVALGARSHNFVEDAEEVERVLRTDNQVVVGIAAVVEVETAQATFIQQL